MFSRVSVFLCLRLMFHDVDYDGTHNYLVVQDQQGGYQEWMVAFNSSKDVQWKDGCYSVEAECDKETMALDPPRSAPICNAISIEGRWFTWRERSK